MHPTYIYIQLFLALIQDGGHLEIIIIILQDRINIMSECFSHINYIGMITNIINVSQLKADITCLDLMCSWRPSWNYYYLVNLNITDVSNINYLKKNT